MSNYGFPPVVIPILGVVAAAIGVAGTAGAGAIAKAQRTEEYYAQIGLTNPAVAALNAQIAGIKDGVGIFRWASKTQQTEHARKEQLIVQRDALIGGAAMVPVSDPNMPYYLVGGVAVLLAAAAATAVAVSRSGSRSNPRKKRRHWKPRPRGLR